MKEYEIMVLHLKIHRENEFATLYVIIKDDSDSFWDSRHKEIFIWSGVLKWSPEQAVGVTCHIRI